MKRKFSFYLNESHHEVASLKQTIDKYHPAGIHNESPEYLQTKEFSAFAEVFTAKIHDETEYQKWTDYLVRLGQQMDVEIESTTMPYQAGYSATISLQSIEKDGIVHTKSLDFYVSNLGAYFTIIGREKVCKSYKRKSGSAVCIPLGEIATVAPAAEFETHFESIEKALSRNYPDHLFMPFSIYSYIVKNSSVYMGNSKRESTVFEAVFAQEGFSKNEYVVGDLFYKMEPWVRKE